MTTNNLSSLVLPLGGMVVVTVLTITLSGVILTRLKQIGEIAPSRTKPRLRLSPQARALVLIVGVGWFALDSWLRYKTGWPYRYGLNCFGKCTLTDTLAYSFLLLHKGRYELALFVSEWVLPVGALAYGLWFLRKWMVGENSDSSGNAQ